MPPKVTDHEIFLHVLLAMAVVMLLAQLMGRLFTRIGQPAVIGEMFAGIMLGPSLLGRVAPEAAAFLFPSSIVGYLRVIAQIGVVLYMFLVGLELDVSRLRSRARSATLISASGIALPLLLGSLVAPFLYKSMAPAGVPSFLFGAFMCVALAVTAFPVLARIVVDRGIDKTPTGIMALTCAAADDIAAWCMLSIVVSFAKSNPSDGLLTVGLAAGYVILMILVARPLLQRFAEREQRDEPLTRATLSMVFGALLLSALATEWIGIHALFGAFLLGALMPSHGRLAERLTAKLEDVVAVLFLPIFFAFTGLRTQLGLMTGLEPWLICLLIIGVAFAGKLGGVFAAAKLSGMATRPALSLGALMNTRGLMELIVLNIGLDLGIISPILFTIMVVMALVTTCTAGPLLSWIGHDTHAESTEPALTPAR
jgi:Kef-type K+ transport system membrane component KefB